MLCLSLRQPWASLLIHGLKRFETRGWKPSPRSLKIIKRDGLLIHASLSKKSAPLMGAPPFSSHLEELGKLPYGAILGRCRVGRIIRTEDWHKEFKPRPGSEWWEEWCFGDFAPGRWAWSIEEPEVFEVPIPWKGSLSLWNYANPIPKPIQELICR